MTHFILGRSPFEVLMKDFFNTDSLFDKIDDCAVNYPVDIYERDEKLNIEIAAVGLDKEDINITVESDVLKVEYRKKQDETGIKDSYIRRGVARRSFNLGWKIGQQFNLEKLEANMDKGLLMITIPYSEQAKPKKITIK